MENERRQEELEKTHSYMETIEEDNVVENRRGTMTKKVKEISNATDELTKTLIRQKNEKVFNEALDREKHTQQRQGFKT